MPPKKKSSGKNPPKARTPTLINGLTKEEMSKEQLEEHIVRLREELDREREERNYFQLERDKIHTFWEITDRKLEEVKAELKNLEKAKEDDEGCHRVEIQVYKQKMKHLLCEHQNTLSELTAHGSDSTEVLQAEQEQLEMMLYKKMKALMIDMQELDNENLVRELELKHDEEMTTARNDWERQLGETTAKYEERMEQLQQELENLSKSVTSEKELQWNGHISALREDHNKIFKDANAIIVDIEKDAGKIGTFKKTIIEKTAKIDKMRNDYRSVLKNNERLARLISKVKKEIAYTEKRISFSAKKANAKEPKTEKLEDLKLEHKVLEQKFSELQLNRDELYKSFAADIESSQCKADVGNVMLEKKLQALTDSLEKKQAQLHSVLSASNMDHTALSGVTSKAEENVESLNSAMKKLEYKRNIISKARRDVQLTTAAEERALCVPFKMLLP
ncbi:dynein regulatory complex subunit 4-like isoform 1-T1 [Odontesthes bonariensis]|uniref:dynein regulatory complex subunit 4-like n=1 Tax=Odontesthes bonariensis TaxID=219752 RepID=UPI003F58041D